MGPESLTDEYSAILAVFEAGWDQRTPVEFENVPFNPPPPEDQKPWVRFVVDGAIEGRQASFGGPGNIHRYEGMITVQVFAPLGKGPGEALQLAQAVAAIFIAARGTLPGITFLTPRVTFKGRSREDSPWYQVNLVVPFRRDTIHL